MALNNKKKITESEDIVEHSADLVFEIYISDIAKHGGYTGSFNALAKEISDAGLQITGKRDSNGTKMIITASGPEECEALESVLTDNGLEPDFVDFVMNNPLQHDGMNFEQAEESLKVLNLLSFALRFWNLLKAMVVDVISLMKGGKISV